jgi:hypothetical protein
VSLLTAPPWTQDSLRVGGYPLPDRDFHPARDAKLILARERQAKEVALAQAEQERQAKEVALVQAEQERQTANALRAELERLQRQRDTASGAQL